MTGSESASTGIASGIDPQLILRQRVFRRSRSQVAVPAALAFVGPVALVAAVLVRGMPAAAVVALLLLPVPLLEALLVLRSRREWPAQDVLGWLDRVTFGLRPLAADGTGETTRGNSDRSPAETTARLAYGAALAAVPLGGDGVAELAAARPAIGRLPEGLTRRLWLGRFRFAILAAALETWTLVAILVAISTASGVVLY